MEEKAYIQKGEFLSKEKYIQEIGLPEYKKIYDEILAKSDCDHHIDNLYFIQLFDYNCPSCVSGVTKVFVEDIEEFSEKYQSMEEDQARVERFLRSKAGEIVTDYYSDDQALNIVQKVAVEDLGWRMSIKRNQSIRVENGYGWTSDYYWGLLILEIRWIKFRNQYYKLVKPSGMDCADKSSFDEQKPWRRIEVYGNPFWINKDMGEYPYSAETVEAYKGTAIECYVWQVADIFDTEEEMRSDQSELSERCLSEEQIARVFADLPGDAG